MISCTLRRTGCAAALLVLAIGLAARPAAAATIAIKNCASVSIDVTVLDELPRVYRGAAYGLMPGASWQGTCQTGACWVSVAIPGQAVASAYSGSICAVPQGSGVTVRYAPCPC